MKLKQVSSKQLIKFFLRKGFVLHHIKGSHNVLIKENELGIVIPNRNLIAIGTLNAILKQSNITKEEYMIFFIKKVLKGELIIMVNMKYKVLINKDENGVFIAECLNLPGCISDGSTKKEVIQNIKEAIIAYNESIKKEEKNSKREIIEVTV